MKEKRIKLKKIPLLVAILSLIPILSFAFIYNNNLEKDITNPDFVTEEVLEETTPVINETKKIINPYLAQDVTIGKSYYDYNGQEEEQINSITVHDNTYMQNTGIDYVSENEFEVVAILEGTVVDVKEDDISGKTVQIKHDNGYVSNYQSLGEVTVKKDDIISQGQVIGKSGTNELEKELGNHLHFEIYVNGQAVNPIDYLDKELKTEKEN
ncbi:MAG: M23 family metallopeptidase [Bacilli bacterium]|nr:M23 family metallopeptidase [Bacilli bacterium]